MTSSGRGTNLNGGITSRVQITTDALNHYTVTVPECFGTECDFAQLQKLFGNWWMDTPEGKYSHRGLRGLYPKSDKATLTLVSFRLRLSKGRT